MGGCCEKEESFRIETAQGRTGDEHEEKRATTTTWDKESMYPPLRKTLVTKRGKSIMLTGVKEQTWEHGKFFEAKKMETNEIVEVKAQVRESAKAKLQYPLNMELIASTRLSALESPCRKVDGNKYNDNCIFVILAPVGRTLDELLSARPQGFTFSTGLRAGIRIFHRIREAHDAGVLVRHVHTSNFALIKPSTPGEKYDGNVTEFVVVTFGYGVVVEKDNLASGNTAKSSLPDFEKTTFLYAPMEEKEMHAKADFGFGRKHDLESWFYMFVDIIGGSLPWRQRTDRKQVADMKLESVKSEGLCDGLPPQTLEIMKLIHDCPKRRRPEYDKIVSHLHNIVNSKKMYANEPYDWET